MSSKKKNQKTNPNKRKNDETVIICPYCGGTHFEYTAEKRRVPSKWYVHVITAIVIIGIAFVMPYFSIAFAIAYVVLTFMPRRFWWAHAKVVVKKRCSIVRRMAA